MPSQKLEDPPIVEVVCGIFFPRIPAIDPIFVGGIQHERAAEYPQHAIHAAVSPGLIFHPGLGLGPLRSWLISPSDEWVLQFQSDRFYVNWRRRANNEYPRFSGTGGVLERTLAEVERFRDCCHNDLKADVKPVTVELAKVDLIWEGRYWNGIDDLGKVIGLVRDIGRFAKSDSLELGLNLIDRDSTGTSQVVTLSLSTEPLLNGSFGRAVKIETRCTAPLAGEGTEAIRTAFVQLNEKANDTFFGLISVDELGRFRRRELEGEEGNHERISSNGA